MYTPVQCDIDFLPIILVQDPFHLWEKSAAGRSLFSRAHERHVFLFEKMIIFSKKTEAASQKKDKKSDNYFYKGHLSVCIRFLLWCCFVIIVKFSLSCRWLKLVWDQSLVGSHFSLSWAYTDNRKYTYFRYQNKQPLFPLLIITSWLSSSTIARYWTNNLLL